MIEDPEHMPHLGWRDMPIEDRDAADLEDEWAREAMLIDAEDLRAGVGKPRTPGGRSRPELPALPEVGTT